MGCANAVSSLGVGRRFILDDVLSQAMSFLLGSPTLRPSRVFECFREGPMQALQLIKESSFDSETINRLGDVFERVWTVVANEYPLADKDAARQQLARMVLGLQTGGTDPSDLVDKALTLMRASKQA